MEQYKISRINELSRKSKKEGLTEEEKKEQAALRQEYLYDMKKNFQATLDNVVVVDGKGNRSPLKKTTGIQ
jgi:uncharacterized protein YnzC (UPF0291/DUF896 family)